MRVVDHATFALDLPPLSLELFSFSLLSADRAARSNGHVALLGPSEELVHLSCDKQLAFCGPRAAVIRNLCMVTYENRHEDLLEDLCHKVTSAAMAVD